MSVFLPFFMFNSSKNGNQADDSDNNTEIMTENPTGALSEKNSVSCHRVSLVQ